MKKNPTDSKQKIVNIEIINENGVTGKVFVAYKTGLSKFQRKITYAFIDGLK